LSQRFTQAIAIAVVLVGAIAIDLPASHAQSIEDRIAGLDSSIANLQTLEQNPNFRRDRLFGVARNLAAMSDRWAELRPRLAQLASPPPIVTDASAPDAALAVVFGAGGAISDPTLAASRFTGFTQSETASAWCGSNVLIGFNDTGSEIKTLIANTGVSALGLSTSANKGAIFSYDGTPTPANSFSQAIMGNPSIACADAAKFYYASIWSDTLNNASGVAIAQSSDGGKSFPPPALAVAKSSLTHLIVRDWLAIDHANPSLLYLSYVDIDYSGEICGNDQFGQAIPRYAIEVVASNNGGANWSAQPTVIEQVCADANHPNLAVTAPQIAIGPEAQVYVAYEAMGENSGALTDREIRIAKSTDGAATFAAPVTVAPVNPLGDGADLQGFVRSGEYPGIAIGQGKTNTGFIYLTWATAAFSVPDSLSTTGLYGFGDIMFAQSQNGGASWSAPLRINNDPEGGANPLSDQFAPAIGSDKNGRIGICFYDRRRDPNNFLIDRYCATSTNNGKSWRNTKITRTNFASLVGQDLLVAPDYMGEYDSIATDGTGQSAGFIDSYSTNAAGNPNIATNHF